MIVVIHEKLLTLIRKNIEELLRINKEKHKPSILLTVVNDSDSNKCF